MHSCNDAYVANWCADPVIVQRSDLDPDFFHFEGFEQSSKDIENQDYDIIAI